MWGERLSAIAFTLRGWRRSACAAASSGAALQQGTHTRFLHALPPHLLLLAPLDRIQAIVLLTQLLHRRRSRRANVHGPPRLQQAHCIRLHRPQRRLKPRQDVTHSAALLLQALHVLEHAHILHILPGAQAGVARHQCTRGAARCAGCAAVGGRVLAPCTAGLLAQAGAGGGGGRSIRRVGRVAIGVCIIVIALALAVAGCVDACASMQQP